MSTQAHPSVAKARLIEFQNVPSEMLGSRNGTESLRIDTPYSLIIPSSSWPALENSAQRLYPTGGLAPMEVFVRRVIASMNVPGQRRYFGTVPLLRQIVLGTLLFSLQRSMDEFTQSSLVSATSTAKSRGSPAGMRIAVGRDKIFVDATHR